MDYTINSHMAHIMSLSRLYNIVVSHDELMQVRDETHAKLMRDLMNSMKAKAGDGHATIITCIPPPYIFYYGFLHVMIACPSPAFAYMLLLISHVIITALACIYYCIFILMKNVILLVLLMQHFNSTMVLQTRHFS